MSTLNLSHLSHRARRAYLKKLKRKKKRQARAQLAEKLELEEFSRLEASPSYQLKLKEEEKHLQLEKERNEQEARDWLNREIAAQEQWREEQRKKAELQRREEELLLRNREERAGVQLEKAPQPEPTNYLIQVESMLFHIQLDSAVVSSHEFSVSCVSLPPFSIFSPMVSVLL
ncbi:unnamed protein product [Dicrocoelium dendriticum]|nr:unnamed protein product [Dicrocoelium dendriticum]